MSGNHADEWLGRLDFRGDEALVGMFLRHRERLRRLAELRLDARLRGRLDASDVVQEVFLEASSGSKPTAAIRRCRPSSGSAS